jgi:hypothetical protein
MNKEFKLWLKAQELMKLKGQSPTNKGIKDLFDIIDVAIAQGKEDELERTIQQDIDKIIT